MVPEVKYRAASSSSVISMLGESTGASLIISKKLGMPGSCLSPRKNACCSPWISSTISLTRSSNSGPKMRTFAPAVSRHFFISSAVNLKLRGTAKAPVFRIPKYMGSHSRQFIIKMATLSFFFIPWDIKALANWLDRLSNSSQVISRRIPRAGSLSIRLVLFG